MGRWQWVKTQKNSCYKTSWKSTKAKPWLAPVTKVIGLGICTCERYWEMKWSEKIIDEKGHGKAGWLEMRWMM